MSNILSFNVDGEDVVVGNVSKINVAGRLYNITDSPAPSGELRITENGTYNVFNYASANVNVAGSGGGISLVAEGVLQPIVIDGYKTKLEIPFPISTGCVFIMIDSSKIADTAADGTHNVGYGMCGMYASFENGVLKNLTAARNYNTDEPLLAYMGNSKVGWDGNEFTIANNVLTIAGDQSGIAYNFQTGVNYKYYVYDAIIAPKYNG